MAGPNLPTNRTAASSIAEHFADHNASHGVVNKIDKDAVAVNGDVLTFDSATVVYKPVPGVFINVKSAPYNAVGNGTTSDTAAIQAAIDAATAVGGGVVLFPPGNYRAAGIILKTGVTLTSGRTMRGYLPGTNQSSTKITTNAAGWVIDTVGGATQCQGASIDGIDIAGSGTATGGIRFQNTDASAIRNVHLHSFVDQAILLDATSGANVLEDILVTQALLDTGRGAAAGGIQIVGNDNFLSRVECSCSQASLTSANFYNNAFYITGANNFIINCVGEFADRGYLTTGSRNRFASCRADRVFGHGFETTTGSGNSFVGCQAVDIGQATTNIYDGFKTSATGNSFAGCVVSKAATNFPRVAFSDSVSNSTITSRNDYAGCLGTYTTAMFSMDGFLGSSPSIPTHPMRPATGTTSIDVTGTSFIVFAAYTGATTVTAFTNGVVGQRLYLLGDTDVTIENNSTIKTSTGANKTLAANRAYCLIHYNSVWYEVGP